MKVTLHQFLFTRGNEICKHVAEKVARNFWAIAKSIICDICVMFEDSQFAFLNSL